MRLYPATAQRYSSPSRSITGTDFQKLPEGLCLPLDGDNVATRIFRSGRTARMDSHDKAAGTHAARIRELGIRSAVGVPIIFDGSVWGAAIVGSSALEPLPPETEARIADFADLVAAAVANAATRAELIASRARIVAAADDGRRRLERDLHDGAQQRLVALGLQLRLTEASVPADLRALGEQLGDIASGLTGVTLELQEISRGIHPAILSKGGIGPALKALARRSAIPVTLELRLTDACPTQSKSARITSCPGPSPTPPSTLAPPTWPCAGKLRTMSSLCRSATTASGAPTSLKAQGSSGSEIGSRPSAGDCGLRARPEAGRR